MSEGRLGDLRGGAPLRRLRKDAGPRRPQRDDITEYAPAVMTAIAMPLTFSIATGLGFITHALCELISGRFAEAKPAVVILAALFAVKFAVS